MKKLTALIFLAGLLLLSYGCGGQAGYSASVGYGYGYPYYGYPYYGYPYSYYGYPYGGYPSYGYPYFDFYDFYYPVHPFFRHEGRELHRVQPVPRQPAPRVAPVPRVAPAPRTPAPRAPAPMTPVPGRR